MSTAGRVMQDKVPEAMPKFFETWCAKFDGVFNRESQRVNFRLYLAGILGETERKNIWSIASSIVDGSYHNFHHFIHDSPWSAADLNNQRLQILQECRQTKLKNGFDLIIDDSGHRKSGNSTMGIGRQYIGQIGKVDNGIVTVTSHGFDGTKGVPIDIRLYKHASSLELGKEDSQFQKKPDIALDLIDECLARGLTPGLVLLDAGYGNNIPLLKKIEEKGLTYVASINKNKIMFYKMLGDTRREKHGIEEIAKSLAPECFAAIELKLEKPRNVWVASIEVYLPKMSGKRKVCIQLNAPTFEEATEVDYYLTNETSEIANAGWIARGYSRRNWVEVFYRESKGWLGIADYEVRDELSMQRHWIIVFCAHSLIQFQQLTGGLRYWAEKPLATFNDALKAYKTAVEFLVVRWISQFPEVFAAHRSNLGYLWR
jgi:hypothetical protein